MLVVGALNSTKRDLLSFAIARASVVFPVPLGPQRISEGRLVFVSAFSSAITFSWPTYPSNVRGRIFSANGTWLPDAEDAGRLTALFELGAAGLLAGGATFGVVTGGLLGFKGVFWVVTGVVGCGFVFLPRKDHWACRLRARHTVSKCLFRSCSSTSVLHTGHATFIASRKFGITRMRTVCVIYA